MTAPSELRDYFADELRQAKLDFSQVTLTAPARSGVRGPWAIAGLGAIVLVAVLVVRSLSPLSGTSGSSAVSPGATSPSVASSVASLVPVGLAGIPAVVDGLPVVRGAAIATHVRSANDASTFLIGGALQDIEIDCASPLIPPVSPLLSSSCGSGWNLVDGSALSGLPLVLGPNVPGWTTITPIVLRVHVHDLRAAECPASFKTACEQAIVVDSVAWSGVLGSPAPSPAGAPSV